MSILRAEVEPVLEALGISQADEALYRLLLEQPGTSVADLAETLTLSERKIRASLGRLERRGLVSRVLGKQNRFLPAPPAPAIEALILNRQEQLERARVAASEMEEVFRASRPRPLSPLDVVEVVLGQEAVDQRFQQLIKGIQDEIQVFDKPPYTTYVIGDNPLERELLSLGVRNRVVYDSGALALPGRMHHLRLMVNAGEEARTLPQLPLKLFIADQRLAFIPLSLDEPGMEGALLIQPSPVLDGLVTLFETLWAHGLPLAFASGENLAESERDDAPLPEDRDVLMLLLAGLKDDTIARQLNIARRTVLRRVSRMMVALNAQTRFQAGWAAARRGWADAPSEPAG